MFIFHGFGSTDLHTTLRPGLTSASTRMGLIPNPARSSRTLIIKEGLFTSLPTEIILQIIEDDALTSWDRACFAASCRRFQNITYPCLYRRFDWITPFNANCTLGLASGFGLLMEILLEPVVSSLSKVFGFAPPPDIHKDSFKKRAEYVREMSVLGGYQYYKEMGVITRYYGPLDHGDQFVNLFGHFQNLRSIELDERASLAWTGYLRVVANILVSKPSLEKLVLRHRLGAQNIGKCEASADMAPIRKILSKGVVAKPKNLVVILGRKFEPTEMGYEYFHQLIEVFDGATEEVTTFRLFANYSKLDETDPLLVDGIRGEGGIVSPARLWSFPKLREIEIQAHNFPKAGAIRSIVKENLAGVTKLKFSCEIMELDLDSLSENLSSFRGVQEIDMWDPQWPETREYTTEELLPICEKLGRLREDLCRLDSISWVLGYHRFTTLCTLNYAVKNKRPDISILRSNGPAAREHIKSTLPQTLRYIKEGYISSRF